MRTYIALLRGINVGGHKQVGMSDLRDLLSALGFADARSLLQSGNLVFRAPARSTPALERVLEREAAARLSVDADFFLRTTDEWHMLIERNPFRAEATRDPGHLLAMCFKSAPAAPAVKALQDGIAGREIVRVDGRHAYIVYPDGVGRSRLTHAVVERKLGTRGTGRNWNTVLKLAALAK